MKIIFYVVIFTFIAIGGKMIYDNYLSASIGRSVESTKDFATDAQIKKLQFSGDGSIVQQ